MCGDKKNKIEKIVWIDSNYKYSGTNNNFIFDFTSFGLDNNAQNITVQLINAIVSTSTATSFFIKSYIKILIDFHTQHNQYSKSLNNYVVAGVISPQYEVKNYYSDYLMKHGPIYRLVNLPIYYVDVRIVDQSNTDLLDNELVPDVPSNVLLCLKFTYDI